MNYKQFAKKLSCLSLSLILLFSSLSVIGHAISSEKVAEIWVHRIYVNGTPTIFLNEQGAEVPAFILNGTTYLPLRSAGEWLGASVTWNGETKEITLQTGGTGKIHADHDLTFVEPNPNGDLISVVERSDIRVFLDGTLCEFKNALGAPVYPVSYNNVTYLPIRNIGTLCGMEVHYDPSANAPDGGSRPTIFLRHPLTDEEIEEITAFTKKIIENNANLKAIAYIMRNETDLFKLHVLATSALEIVKEMKAIPKYKSEFGKFYCNFIDQALQMREDALLLMVSSLDSPEDMEKGKKLFYEPNIIPDLGDASDAAGRIQLALEQHIG